MNRSKCCSSYIFVFDSVRLSSIIFCSVLSSVLAYLNFPFASTPQTWRTPLTGRLSQASSSARLEGNGML
jgi:hypothetical protein